MNRLLWSKIQEIYLIFNLWILDHIWHVSSAVYVSVFFDYPLFTGQCEQLARSTWNILLDWLEKNLTTEIKYFSSLRFVIMSENVSLVWRRKNHPQCRKEWAIYYREDKNKRELNFIISLFSCLLFLVFQLRVN